MARISADTHIRTDKNLGPSNLHRLIIILIRETRVYPRPIHFFDSALMIHWINSTSSACSALLCNPLFSSCSPASLRQLLTATATAVELAVLHNFVWHQRWTWRDRPSKSSGETLFRLLKFNVSNGLLSIFGNLVFMSVLVGRLGLPVSPANVISVAACSLCNFFLADRIAFDMQRTASPAES